MTSLKLGLAVACYGGWREELYSELNRVAEQLSVAAAIVDPSVVGSRLHAFTAAIHAYVLHLRGKPIARRVGIEVVLHLTGERNISKALSLAAPRSGRVLLIAVGPYENVNRLLNQLDKLTLRAEQCCLNPVEACRKLTSAPGCSDAESAERILVTRSAAFILEA
jgi:tRNA threonylcarbamoyladenosine modification (KEOPS) complex Cgi121 subunit